MIRKGGFAHINVYYVVVSFKYTRYINIVAEYTRIQYIQIYLERTRL